VTVPRLASVCPSSFTTSGSIAKTQASTWQPCRPPRRNIGKRDADAWNKWEERARVPPLSQGRMAAYPADPIPGQPGHHWLRLQADGPPLEQANGRQGLENPVERRRMVPRRNGSTSVLARMREGRGQPRDRCIGHTQPERIPAARYTEGWQPGAVQRLPPRFHIQVTRWGRLGGASGGAHPTPQGRSFPGWVAQTPTQTPASQTKQLKELVCGPPLAPVLAPACPVQRGLVTPHSCEAIYG